jgi:hypothetical protein
VRAAHSHHTKLLLLSISLVGSFFLLTHATLLFWVLVIWCALCFYVDFCLVVDCSIPFSSNKFLSFLSQKKKKKKEKQKEKEVN